MNYRKAVFIVTYTKERGKTIYLLLKRKLHWTGWEFPKGGVESGEPLMLAVIRELGEETSQVPVLVRKFNVSGKYEYDSRTAKERKFQGQEYVLFSAEIKGRKIKLDKKEHSGFKFVDFKTALKTLTWKNQKDCLRIVNKSI
jgi:8-oxo-dGTP pyrophosphatase MutT (NUDIX family)